MKEIYFEKELKVKLRRFRRLIGKIDPELEKILEESIETIEKLMKKEKKKILYTFDNLLINELDNLKEFKLLWPFLEDFTIFDDADIDKYPYPSLDVSNEELLTLTYDFFKNGTSTYFFSLFKQLFKQRRRILFINSSIPEFYGDLTFLNYDKTIYMQIKREHEFNDIITMAHEYGHGIQFLINYNRNIHYSLFPFSEIISIFFELICGHYYSKDKSLCSKAIISLYDNWNMVCKDAIALNQEIQIFNTTGIHGYESIDEIQHKLFTCFNEMNMDQLLNLFILQPSFDFVYVFAYSIATNLFMIYLRDPDYAFYLLQKLIEIDLSLSPEQYLDEIFNLGIIPNEKLEEFDKHLKRELKRI